MEFILPRPPGRIVSIGADSPAGVNATWRAALVARELGGELRILHRSARRADTALRELADEIRQRTKVSVTVDTLQGDVLREAMAASRDAAMLVVPGMRGNPLRQWILGTQAERLIRLCRSPVLVVKRPALAAYRRVLVPLDIEEQAARLVAVAASLSRGSRVELLHAIDAADEKVLRELGDLQDALHGWRQHRAQGALLALHRLIDAAQVSESATQATIEFGPAARVILARAQARDAELVVIGKAQRGLLAGWFLGGLTQRMLAHVPADVLVQPAAAPAAAREPAVRAPQFAIPSRAT